MYDAEGNILTDFEVFERFLEQVKAPVTIHIDYQNDKKVVTFNTSVIAFRFTLTGEFVCLYDQIKVG